MPHQLKRMAKRAALGVARGGSPGGNNSGDIFLAFSNANSNPMPMLSKSKLQFEYINDEVFDEIYLLTQGGPGTATEVISFSIYETFFDSDNMGLGSVMSVVSLFVISLLIIVVLNIIRRANKYAN